jgi:hypothetical protein
MLKNSVLKRLASVGLALALTAGSVSLTATEAEARRGLGYGIAAGVIAGSIYGAYAYGAPRYRPTYGYTSTYVSGGSCYKGPRQCDWSGRSCWLNRYGERICGGGEWLCWRPTVCD